jgi:hypothetical protein
MEWRVLQSGALLCSAGIALVAACGDAEQDTTLPQAGGSGGISQDAGGFGGSSASGTGGGHAGQGGGKGGDSGVAGTGGPGGNGGSAGTGAAAGTGAGGTAGAAGAANAIGAWYHGPLDRTLEGSFDGNTTMLYAAAGRALLVIDATTPGSPVLKASVPNAVYTQGGGPMMGHHYASASGLVFGAVDGKVVITDVSDPANSHIVTTYEPSGGAVASSVAAQGNYVYVATNRGLHIVNVSSPASPVQSAVYASTRSIGGVLVSGNWAFVNAAKTVTAIDVSNPTAPAEHHNYTSTHASIVQDMAISADGNTLYVSFYGSIDFLNVANKDQLALRTSWTWDAPFHTGATSYVEPNGSYLYVAIHDNNFAPSNGPAGRWGIILDASDPSNPHCVPVPADAGTAVPECNNTFNLFEYDLGYPCDPKVLGNKMFMGMQYAGLRPFDATDPAHPIMNPVYYQALQPNHIPVYGRPMSIDGNGSRAVAVDDKGLLVFDTSNIQAPTLQSYTDLNARGFDVALVDNVAYTASTWGGFNVIDVSNPTTPTILKQRIYPANMANVNALAVANHRAYLVGPGGTAAYAAVYDVSTPSNPTLLHPSVLINAPGFHAAMAKVVVSGDYLYVTGGAAGLIVFRIAADGALTQIAQALDTGNPSKLSMAEAVAAHGQYVYLADYSKSQLSVVDVTNPAAPVIGNPVSLTINPGSLSIQGNYLVVGGSQETPSDSIVVVDVSNAAAPSVVKTVSKSFRASNVRTDTNGNVFVAAHADGIRTMTMQTILNLP